MKYLKEMKESGRSTIDPISLGERIERVREMCRLSRADFSCFIYGNGSPPHDALALLSDLEGGNYFSTEDGMNEYIDTVIDACKIECEWLCYGTGDVFDYDRLIDEIEAAESFRDERSRLIFERLPVGERVRLVRMKNRLSVRKFGESLGVSPTSISNIERGNRGLTATMAKTISNEYKVNEKWLRGGKGPIFATLEEEPKIEVPKMSADKLTRGMAEIVSDGVEKLSNTDLNNLIDSATFLLSITRRELDKREEKTK